MSAYVLGFITGLGLSLVVGVVIAQMSSEWRMDYRQRAEPVVTRARALIASDVEAMAARDTAEQRVVEQRVVIEQMLGLIDERGA